MRIAAVIPARFASTRFPGKPLVSISGISMIERVYRQIVSAACFDEVLVATDDSRIKKAIVSIGGNVVMTESSLPSGTDRIWAALGSYKFDAVVNVQGDEPLIDLQLLRDIRLALSANSYSVVSAVFRNESYVDFMSPHSVKVVMDANDRALYFSRSPIPFSDETSFTFFWHHIGIYGYPLNLLELFVKTSPSSLEMHEKLEQLRLLSLGVTYQMIRTKFKSHGVDTPADVARIEEILRGYHA